MVLEYQGTRYNGWQTQPHGNTVQDVVESRLALILNHPVRVYGAGRTDRGVHARGQVASLETANPMELERMFRGLNALLPADVAAVEWAEAAPGFHARHSARGREYCYQIWRGRVCSPFHHPFVHHLYRRPLSLEAMNEAAARVVGRHDFTSFCAADSAGEDMVKDVHFSRWEAHDEMWQYRVSARSFVHHMVRNLVGVFIEVGLGRRTPQDIDRILAARARRAAGPMAPAQGLFLERVDYEDPATSNGGEA